MKSLYSIIFINLLFTCNLMAQCFDADESIWLDTWASCQSNPNPKPTYGDSHWIQYDFGEIRKLSKTWVWNTNDPAKLSQGFNQVKIDYSNDGSTWTYWGEMSFPMAQGEAIYGGFPGPNLYGIDARYVLLTAITNHGDPSCFGIAEIKFNLYPELIQGEFNDDILNCEEGFEEGVYIEMLEDIGVYFYWEFDVGPGLEFIFEYRELGEPDWVQIYGLEESEFFLEFLEPNTTYEFRVRADCNGEIITSEIGTFTTPDGTFECDKVEDIWLVEATETTATIEWEPVGDEDYYLIRYGFADEPYLEEEEESETPIIYLEDLEPFTEYALRIGNFCEEEQINYSDEFLFMTGATDVDETSSNQNRLRLFPNPTSGRFSLEYYSDTDNQLSYTITDLAGKVLQNNTTRVAQGMNIQEIDLSDLPDGLYIINTVTTIAGRSISEKIVKIKQ